MEVFFVDYTHGKLGRGTIMSFPIKLCLHRFVVGVEIEKKRLEKENIDCLGEGVGKKRRRKAIY